jgi:hypothetical protein
MTFKYLDENTSCNCTSGAGIDSTSLYARRIGKVNSLKDRDFKTNFEKGKALNDALKSCDEVCGSFGISVDKWDDKTKDEVMDKYLTTFKIAPKHKNNVCVIKFNAAAGKTKHTPIKSDPANLHHHDFYKSDSFSLENHVDLVEIIPIKL